MQEVLDISDRPVAPELQFYSEVYQQYAAPLHGYITKLEKDPVIAEAILVASFTAIFRSLHLFDPRKTNLFTWMMQLTLQQCSNISSVQKSVIIEKFGTVVTTTVMKLANPAEEGGLIPAFLTTQLNCCSIEENLRGKKNS